MPSQPLGDGVAVVDVPVHARAGVTARGAGDDAAAGALGRPPSRGQRPAVVAEGVDEMQLGPGAEDLAQHDGRRALVDAELDHAPAAARRRAQDGGVVV